MATKRVQLRSRIKKAIEAQLKKKKVMDHAHYKDLVEDYLSFWDIKNHLVDDIDLRGVSVYWSNGGGQEGYKKNESIAELLKVNKQMLTILNDLGIRASELKVDEDDEGL